MSPRTHTLILVAVTLVAFSCSQDEQPSPRRAGQAKLRASIGSFDPAKSAFFLARQIRTGEADKTIVFGNPGDLPLTGDWNGDGIDTIGIYRPSTNTFYLANDLDHPVGDIEAKVQIKGDTTNLVPLAGDWDGNGTVTPALYRPSDSTFFIRNSQGSGPAEIAAAFGSPGDVPIAGDWDGDGVTTVGVYRPSTATFFLTNSRTASQADMSIVFGAAGDVPVVGDWSGSGKTTIGVFRPSTATFFVRMTNTAGQADVNATFGSPKYVPLAGRWQF